MPEEITPFKLTVLEPEIVEMDFSKVRLLCMAKGMDSCYSNLPTLVECTSSQCHMVRR